MAKLSYKARERQRREQEILKTVAQFINARGYASLNMDDIAEAVGVSKPTLYQHFKSKDEMVIGAMLYSMKQMDDHMEDLRDKPPLVQLESILRYLLVSHTTPDEFPVTYVHETSFESLDSFQHVMGQMYKTGDYLENVIRQGQESGEIIANIPPMVIISSLFSMLSILQWPGYRESKDTLVEGIVKFYMNGVRAR